MAEMKMDPRIITHQENVGADQQNATQRRKREGCMLAQLEKHTPSKSKQSLGLIPVLPPVDQFTYPFKTLVYSSVRLHTVCKGLSQRLE